MPSGSLGTGDKPEASYDVYAIPSGTGAPYVFMVLTFGATESSRAARRSISAAERNAASTASTSAKQIALGYAGSPDRAVQRSRYMTLETMAQMSDDPQISLPAVAR
nr:hypothetical protein A4A59_08600 [Rhizobium leguminosarum]